MYVHTYISSFLKLIIPQRNEYVKIANLDEFAVAVPSMAIGRDRTVPYGTVTNFFFMNYRLMRRK